MAVGAFAFVSIVVFDFFACLEDISNLVTQLVNCLINNFSFAISCNKESVLLELDIGASIGKMWVLSSSKCGVLAYSWVSLIASGYPERSMLNVIHLWHVKENSGSPILGSEILL